MKEWEENENKREKMTSGREENTEISKQESKESDFIRYWAFQTDFGYDDQLATVKH